MNTCKTCKYFELAGPNHASYYKGSGRCNCPKLIVDHPAKTTEPGPDTLNVITDIGYPEIEVGIDFGCVHHESRQA